MEKIPKDLKRLVNSIKDLTFDRAHFARFGDYSKSFDLVFYVESKDYLTYMDCLHKVNLKIQEYFEKEKIQFAYPTQTIFTKRGR